MSSEMQEAAIERRDEMHLAIIVLCMSTGFLVLFGLLMVYSATAPASINEAVSGSTTMLFRKAHMQVAFAAVSFVFMLVMVRLSVRTYNRAAFGLFVLGLVLQVLVLTPLGVESGGNRNWIGRFGFTVQPSEFLKLAFIVFAARTLAGFRPDREDRWRILGRFAVASGLAIVDVMLGKDLGTALVFMLVVVAMFWVSGGPAKVLLAAGALGLAVLAVAVADERSRLFRIRQWADALVTPPDTVDPSQVDYALWAFGTGGVFGTGLGTATEKWPGNLPEIHTDFILAVIGEEFGFAGCLLVIVGFLALGWSIVRVATLHPSRFARLAAAGIAVWLVGQGLANMLVVTGVLPVFGVPLPFMSQGGSSLMSSLFAVGLVLAFALDVPGVRESFEARLPLVRRAHATVSGGKNE